MTSVPVRYAITLLSCFADASHDSFSDPVGVYLSTMVILVMVFIPCELLYHVSFAASTGSTLQVTSQVASAGAR